MHRSQGDLWFIFNLRKNKRGLVIYTHTIILVILWSYSLSVIDCRFVHTWTLWRHWPCGEWVYSDPTFWELPMLWLGLAFLYLALSRSLQIQSSNSQALRNHTNTHYKLEYHEQHSNYILQHIFSFSQHFYEQVEEGQLAPNNSVWHRYDM